MTIQTTPVFYFIEAVDNTNFALNFVEPNIGPTELEAQLTAGARTMTDLMVEVERAMNDAGQETYTVTLDRTTRLVTISSTDTVELLVATGSNGNSVFPLLGFTGADRTGASSYTGDTAIGTEYIPQFPLQDFVDFDNNLDNIQSSVQETASSVVEVITFGNRQFTEFNITFITDRFKTKGNIIQNNSSAVAEARAFMTFAITKQNIEFMKDKSNRGTFDTMLLERTPQARDGTAFLLRELVNRGFEDYFETGRIRFRKVT